MYEALDAAFKELNFILWTQTATEICRQGCERSCLGLGMSPAGVGRLDWSRGVSRGRSK